MGERGPGARTIPGLGDAGDGTGRDGTGGESKVVASPEDGAFGGEGIGGGRAP